MEYHKADLMTLLANRQPSQIYTSLPAFSHQDALLSVSNSSQLVRWPFAFLFALASRWSSLFDRFLPFFIWLLPWPCSTSKAMYAWPKGTILSRITCASLRTASYRLLILPAASLGNFEPGSYRKSLMASLVISNIAMPSSWHMAMCLKLRSKGTITCNGSRVAKLQCCLLQ